MEKNALNHSLAQTSCLSGSPVTRTAVAGDAGADGSSSQLGKRLPRMPRAMLQATKTLLSPPLPPSWAAPPCPGAAPTQRTASCTLLPRVCGTGSKGARADGWIWPEQEVARHPSHPGPCYKRRREGEGKAPVDPSCLPPQSASAGGKGKATPVSESTPLEQERVVTEHPFTAPAAEPGVARPSRRRPNSQEQATDSRAAPISVGTDMP